MAKKEKEHGVIREGSIADQIINSLRGIVDDADEWLEGPSKEEKIKAERRRRLKRRELYPEELEKERKAQAEDIAAEVEPSGPTVPAVGQAAMSQSDLSRRAAHTRGTAAKPGQGPAASLVSTGKGKVHSGSRDFASDSKRRTESGTQPAAKPAVTRDADPAPEPEPESQTSALQRRIEELEASLAKLQGTAGRVEHVLPDREQNPNYYRAGGAGPTLSAADLEARGYESQTPEEFEAGKLAASAPPSPSPHRGYEEVAGALGGGPMDPGAASAIAAGNQEDAARGGGNRGLMAALGGALGGARDAVGGVAGAVGGALSAAGGGPADPNDMPLKPEHQGKTKRELAALKRMGVDIYQRTPQFPIRGRGGL